MGQLDSVDRHLLELLQRGIPITHRPFEALAGRLAIGESDLLARTKRLKDASIIRQIGAIFDSAALGHRSALVAFKLDAGDVDEVAARVSEHPGVTHCYLRDSEFSLWFTITVGPDADLTSEVEALASLPRVKAYLFLPALKVFKINVFLPMSGDQTGIEVNLEPYARPTAVDLDEHDRAAVRALQCDLPLVSRPFAALAREVGTSEGDLIARAERLRRLGAMRRLAAVLRHHSAGYTVNSMVCWRVEPERIDQVGRTLASDLAVSHCYERPVADGWPYALYTMVHCRSDQEMREAIDRLALAVHEDHVVLRTLKEYKKTRVAYFAEASSPEREEEA